ncbi:hypothetical protein M5D96_009443, partial [Drosophila gunungcola]
MDGISSETFGYQRMPEPEQMAFDWQLERIWLPLDMYSLKNLPKPFASSLLEGRVFAIDSNWFRHLGGWDDGLRNTGGDALELSLKVWQCGGRILTIPCSRVGLIFKRDEAVAQIAPNRNHNIQVRKMIIDRIIVPTLSASKTVAEIVSQFKIELHFCTNIFAHSEIIDV